MTTSTLGAATVPAAATRVPTPARPPGPHRRGDPPWVRPALLALLGATAVLYLWGLGASGWANAYYSAAVQAGTRSWKAFFFGSLDWSNFITVDKSPAFLWPMELSARLFGVNAWSILVPQALEGVATVGLLYATVRRWFTPVAGLLAGAVVAVTPVAGLIFRYNNPDALLVLVLTAAAYAMTRALEHGTSRWLALAFALVGFGFLAKMLQTFLVVPPFVLAYLVSAPGTLGRRVRQLAMAGLAMLAAAGWWVVAVELTPGADRPYIGGSQNNSLWNLIFGYNGFGRLTGNEAGSVGGGSPSTGRWGPTGLTRLFNTSFGGQISWLVPAALIVLASGLAITWRRPRTDRSRAALILWGGTLVVTAAVFSLSHGIIHPYYTVALAPAIGAVLAIGAVTAWRQRRPAAWYTLGAAFVATVVWSDHLLERTPAWHPWVRQAVLAGGLMVAAVWCVWPLVAPRPSRLLVAAAVLVGLLGPGAYTLATAASAHSGAIPSAGPSIGFGATGGPGPGGPAGSTGARSVSPGPGGPAGGLLDGTRVTSTLATLLSRGGTGYRWVAATVDANNAASYQLAAGQAVMAIGGFNGTDPAPTLAQFQQDVAHHEIHSFLTTTNGQFGGATAGTDTPTQIETWVADHFTARQVGGVTVYDLTVAGGSGS